MCALVTGVQTFALPICAVRRLVKGWPDRILLRGICQQGEQSAAQRAAGASAKRQQWIQSGTGGRHRRLLRFPIQQGYNGRQINDVVAYRSEEHTSELQSLMRISNAVVCLKKKNTTQ